MNTLDKIKGRCKIDDITGCWLWTGAMSGGRFPRIYAPKYGKNGAKCTTQTGARAVWQAKTGKAIPPGFRVFHKACTNDACVNPAHLDCGPTEAWGKQLQKTGAWADQPTRILANQAIGRARSAASIEIAREICASSDTGLALAARYGISRSVVSKIRRGQLRSITAVINPFAGLMK